MDDDNQPPPPEAARAPAGGHDLWENRLKRYVESDKNYTVGRLFLIIGSIGFAVVFGLNLLGLFVFGEPGAQFFSDRWWGEWFVEYAIWPIFMIIGLAFVLTRRNKPSRGSA